MDGRPLPSQKERIKGLIEGDATASQKEKIKELMKTTKTNSTEMHVLMQQNISLKNKTFATITNKDADLIINLLTKKKGFSND